MNGTDEELGFRLRKRQIQRIGLVCITDLDLDFVNDIAMVSEEVEQAHKLLQIV